MNQLDFSVLKITVLKGYGPDHVSVWTNLPSPMPNVTKQGLILNFQVAAGDGVAYVKQHFGVDPEVIDLENRYQHQEGK